ncbi:DUF6668 family protein [Kocuria carniphila]|uniref:DUF6668 family protein n=1 Tax=Kocuria carniphila TaxID=262208 RepID=UPI00268B9536
MKLGLRNEPHKISTENGESKSAPPKQSANPFLIPHEEETHTPNIIDKDPVLGDSISISGRAVDSDAANVAGLWLIGAAGGVGVSTLAGACSREVHDSEELSPPWGGRVAIVTSCARSSLETTQELVRSSESGKVAWEAVAIILVHDRPANLISKETRTYARTTLRMVRKSFSIPYLPELRESSQPELDLSVTRSQKVVDALNKLAKKVSSKQKEKQQ